MAYTQEQVWEAVYSVIPGYKIANENGTRLNLPSCVRHVAADMFIHRIIDTPEAEIVRISLSDLQTHGWFLFAT